MTNRESETAATGVRAVDLERYEREMRGNEARDLTEAKEGLVDALLSLTMRRCTGEGPEGAVIYGVRPSAKLVSGFLLPRFDPTGLEDETSDIRIATMGVDLQLAAESSGEVVVRPEICIYVRVLPRWDEIMDPRHDMAPLVQLSREARRLVDERAATYIQERSAALPPVEDEAEAEEPGNAVAQAEQARENADRAEEAQAEAGAGDMEARGEARAAAQAAERAERVAATRQAENARRLAARRERNAAMTAIRREAFDRAFAELGIRLIGPQEDGVGERTVTAEDLIEEVQTDLSDASAGAFTLEVAETEDNPEEGTPIAAGATVIVRPGAGRIEDRHAAPQPIPQKWKRFALSLDEVRFNYADIRSLDEATSGFPTGLARAVDAVLALWLASEEGQAEAYRPGERILPSNFASRESWEQYLAALRARRPAVLEDVRPDLNGVTLVGTSDADFVDPNRVNLRIALENGAAEPSGREAAAFEHAIFQVRLRISVPAAVHRPLRLDRVEPSYRFRDWLEYPAMGLNCGVRSTVGENGRVTVETTWAPRYVQPRIDPRIVADVPTSYEELSSEATDPRRLFALPDSYDDWIHEQSRVDVGLGLAPEQAEEERRTHGRDLDAYRRESCYIRQGIEVLCAAREARRQLNEAPPVTSEERARLIRRGAPWEAWLRTNETFALHGDTRLTNWHLFQLAFILAHIPTLASRMPEFQDKFDSFRDELSASLLYFPTGGGKSEAFFGLFIFNIFLDRLRGKQRGVTALIRYPLRLLTLQQARRLTRILVTAELVRQRRQIAGWPFELGFWVGSGNTPNRVAQGFGGVPSVTVAAHSDDHVLLNPPTGSSREEAAARRRSARYREALEMYDKLRICPCCGSATGMRKYPAQFGRIGIVCFNDACVWNGAHRGGTHRVPLPFLLTDDTIYQRAPSVVLGTIDKLALIGQHDRTINAVVGMLGCARYIDPASGHLFVPRGERAIARAIANGWTPVRPAFATGVEVFHDPFPSLIIQDEGHLLDESLGTFSGLFETALEQIVCCLGQGMLRAKVVMWRPADGCERPRLGKVIAATATISDPERQLRVLYQREALRFPCPGPSLYESFYASPREPLPAARRDFAQLLPPHQRPELSAPRMRVYVSIMTNGRSHTMTTSSVVSAYHVVLTRLWQLIIEEGRAADAVTEIVSALPIEDPLSSLRADALRRLSHGEGVSVLATLLDLLRISLTYVTNKKGGDQIIETLASQVERDQKREGIGDLPFTTDLISGGVTVAEIQNVMQRAEAGVQPGQPFPVLGESLRNIVATSAVSHGVDVDRFNAMFFAGLPADIAEYIQASSRVGRRHVGFSLLVPTPQSRRDRYVIETHDQFHRFLERMIPPPAVQRWADRAIRRMIPSVLQSYLCGVVEQELFANAADSQKTRTRTFTTAAAIKAWADGFSGGYPAAVRAVAGFALAGVGLDGRGDQHTGAAPHAEHYRQFIEDRVRELLDIFTARSDGSRLSVFWHMIASRQIRQPMTSLRDVDAGGVIQGAMRDPFRGKNLNLETVRQVMRIIRGQRMAVHAEVDAEPAPVDVED
jgi:hypothetical protein